MLEAIIGGIVGAFSAFLFNVIQWRMNLVDTRIQSLASMCVDNIDKLELCSRQYWANGITDKDTKKSLEIEIKSRTLLNQRFVSELMFKIAAEQKSSDVIKVNDLCGSIFDQATSGSFESSQHTVDVVCASKVSKMCYEEKFLILRLVLNTNKKFFFF